LNTFIRLTPGEQKCLANLQSRTKKVAAGTELVFEGQLQHIAYVLQRGWAYSYKLLPDGRRQVITILIPGDFLGLRGIQQDAADHSINTATHSVVSLISLASLRGTFKECPRLGEAIRGAVSREEAILVEHLIDLGRRSAIERTAHFFLELRDRLALVGNSSETEFECPLNQYLLSDALGLTAIHLNRVLRQLRESGCMTLRNDRVVIHDVKALTQLSGYDNAYLDLFAASARTALLL